MGSQFPHISQYLLYNNHPCETELPCHSEFDLHYPADFLKRSLFSYTVGYLIVLQKVCVRVYCPIPDSFGFFWMGDVVLFAFILFVKEKNLKSLKMKFLENKQLSCDLL